MRLYQRHRQPVHRVVVDFVGTGTAMWGRERLIARHPVTGKGLLSRCRGYDPIQVAETRNPAGDVSQLRMLCEPALEICSAGLCIADMDEMTGHAAWHPG